MKLFIASCLTLIFSLASVICVVIVGQEIYDGVTTNTITYTGTVCALLAVICIGIIILFAFLLERRRAKTKRTWKFPWIVLFAILVFATQQFGRTFFPTKQTKQHIVACSSQWCCPSQFTVSLSNIANNLFLFYYGLIALLTIWILFLKFLRKPKIQIMSDKEQKELG